MKVLILHSTAGEGHRKIAEAIRDELRQKNPTANVLCVDAFDYTPKFLAESYPKTYFYAVKWFPKFWGFLYEFTDIAGVYRVLEPIRQMWNQLFSKKLRDWILSESPDVIVSTHFFAAQVCADMKRKKIFTARIITVITDVMPHSFWINPGTDLYWVMAQESSRVLIRRGVPGESIECGGIPVNELFLKPIDRTKVSYELGLVDHRLNLLFSSGSFGIGPTEKWLRELEVFGNKIQVMVVCGKNRTLFDKLSDKKFSFPIILMGFVNNMHELMGVSDFLIAKSGGSTTCESLSKKLPMLITSPIPGQETRNAKWLLDNQAAKNLTRPGDLRQIIELFFNKQLDYQSLQSNIARISKPHAASRLTDHILSVA